MAQAQAQAQALSADPGKAETPIAWWALIAVPSFVSGVWAIYVASFPQIMEANGGYERMWSIPIIGFLHTAGGGLASLIGPFQFMKGLRRGRLEWHRLLGRIYLVAVGLSALAGLYLSPGSLAANTYGIAFIALAASWFYTGWMAYRTIRARDVAAHRRWMIRNFALTFAAVTLRVEMPLLIMAGLDPIMALNVVGVLCWVPNLIAVEWWLRNRDTEPGSLARMAAARA